MIRRLAVALLAVLAHLPPAEPGESAAPPLADMARQLFDYPSYPRGDRDGVVRFAIAASKDFQGTPMAELAARLALAYDPASLSSVAVGEAEARRLLDSEADLDPGLRDVLRRFLARALAAGGRRDEALALHRRRGLAMSWLAAGPFHGRRTASLDSPELPEAGPIIVGDPTAEPPDAARFREWRAKPPWRRIPGNLAFPFVRPWRWPELERNGAMLMFTGLVMDAPDNKAIFHVHADVSWRLYIDGRMAAEVDRDGSAEEPVEHLVSFPLAAGAHAVFLHLFHPNPGVAADAARVALRLESSAPFAWDSGAVEPKPFKPVNARREARRLKYLEDLHAAMDGAPILAAAYAAACLGQGMPDAASWWMDRAARAEPANVNLKAFAGVLTAGNPLLPPERRLDMAAAWHREALLARPDIVPSLLFLAAAASDAGQAREARLLVERATAANSNSIDVKLARAAWADRFASSAAARAAWDECARAFPDSPSVQLAVAAAPGEDSLDMERRLAACRAAAAAGPYISDASLRLAGALADSGNGQEAGYVLRDAAGLFAGDADALRGIADVYAKLTMHREAVEAMSEAVRLAPDNPDFWRRLGDLHMETGDPAMARKYWDASLAADPGQFNLADMVDSLAGKPDPLYADARYDAIAMTAAADVKRYPGDVARLLERSELTFAADGSHRRVTHEVDLAKNRRGGEALASMDARGEMLTARIVFANGHTLEPEPFPAQGGLRLPVVPPGAARELKVLESVMIDSDDTPLAPPWFFQDISGRIPFLISEYVVRTPSGFPLVHAVRNLGNLVEFDSSREDGFEVNRWTAKLNPPSREPDAVHISERVPSVEIGVKTTWEDVAFREWRRLEWRLKPSRRMFSLLSLLRHGGSGSRPDPESAARAIYRYVCDNIDPNPAGEMAAHIHADHMGDRRLLLLALLRAAGLDANPAAARPNPNFLHPPSWELPSMDIFTTPLVRLALPGGVVRWLDARFDSLPFGGIPDDLSGATVLTCLPDGPLFETMPKLPAEDSLVARDMVLRLPDRPGDAAMASGRVLTRGVAGLLQSRALQQAGPDERKRMILGMVFPVFPDGVLSYHEIARTERVEASSNFYYELESRHPLEARPGGAIAISLCLPPPGIISAETRNLSRRRTTCHIRSERIAEDRNSFILPPGASLVRIPGAARIPSRFGVYQLRILPRDDNRLEIIRDYHVPAQRIPPWEWANFLTFLEQIDMAERQWIEYALPAAGN